MGFYPSLPEGYWHQTVWAPQRNGTKWEFHRVYDRDGHLDRSRSFWIVFPLNAPDFPPPRRVVAWADVPGVSFDEFARATTTLAEVEAWIERASKKQRNVRRESRIGQLQAA